MARLIVSALIVKALLDVAAGHSCHDGHRVQCTAVKSSNGAPSTMGESYDASGYPMCSEDGKKLFCLYDHDYHHCQDGFAPCCEDGSNPSHGGHFDGNDHNLECSATATSASQTDNVMASSAHTASTAQQSTAQESTISIVLDNMDSTVVAESKNAHEGTYTPCMVDAYNGQFHHDWARNKGAASFTFKFQPPADGCYLIEEYHPGKTWECSRYLPSNAQLKVDYCKGKSHTTTIDQTKNAGQWNPIGHLIFYKGVEGKLTMSNSPDDLCQDNCFWVVDAFRLTWKASSCESMSGSTADEAAPAQGTLSLSLSLADGQTMEMVRWQLGIGKATLEATMATHLGYKSVSIVDFEVSGRRLMETQQLRIIYTAQDKIREPNQASLKQALQSDLTALYPGLTLTDLTVELPSAQPANTESADDGSNSTLWIGVAAASMVLLLVLSFGVWTCRKKRAVNQETVVKSKVVEVEPVNDENIVKEIDDIEKAFDKNKTVESCETASTGTPNSEPQVSEESGSKQGDDPTLVAVPSA
jgi:hypothetical protein